MLAQHHLPLVLGLRLARPAAASRPGVTDTGSASAIALAWDGTD